MEEEWLINLDKTMRESNNKRIVVGLKSGNAVKGWYRTITIEKINDKFVNILIISSMNKNNVLDIPETNIEFISRPIDFRGQ